MGSASPYRARFMGLPPCGQPSRDGEVPLGDNGEKYYGLVNVANTCYVNSVLQALYSCSHFRKSAIRHLVEEKEDDAGGESLLTSLAELFAQIDGQKKPVGCITPRRFLARLRKASDLFCTSEHQDAHEFMQFLLNDFDENLKARVKRQREKEKQKLLSQQTQAGGPPQQGSGPEEEEEEQPEEEHRTWIHDIFQGYLVNQMKCLCCENVSVRRETFLDLSVDIERHTSIAACLRAFESTELLRCGNKFFCDMCGCLQEAEKRLRIYQLPSVLMLHLKRFKYVERLGRSCRLPYRVVFPLQLRVVEHRPPPRGRATGNGTKSGRDHGVTMTSASTEGGPTSDDESTSAREQTTQRLFELRSVVVHIGRDPQRGHYVTVVRSGDHRCVLLDDDVVRVVEPEVLRSFYGTAGNSHYHTNNLHTVSGHEGGNSNRMGTSTANNDRYPSSSPMTPLYERSPEGTCCGYLLLYEAVDGAPQDSDAASAPDIAAAANWISEEQNLTDSDSGESTEERPGGGGGERSPQHPNITDDSELTQAFEQRCIPRGPATRYVPSGTNGHNSGSGVANGQGPAPQTPDRTTPNGAAGQAFAWTAADEEGGPAPTSSPNGAGASSPSAHGAGVRTLGSVVPAVAPDAVSPSRVNVVTMPSPTDSEGGRRRGLGDGEPERG